MQAEAEVVSSSSAWEGKVEGLLKQHQQTVSDLKQRLEQQDGDVRSGNVTVEQYQAKYALMLLPRQSASSYGLCNTAQLVLVALQPICS